MDKKLNVNRARKTPRSIGEIQRMKQLLDQLLEELSEEDQKRLDEVIRTKGRDLLRKHMQSD